MRVPFIRPALTVALFVTIATFTTSADAPPASPVQQVPAACIPPSFGDPPINRPIDRATSGCGLEGEPSADDADSAAKQEAQNLVKNEFCAWQDTDPALVTRRSFDQLMTQLPTGIPWGSRTRMPTAQQRERLGAFYTTSEGDAIGEGSYVQFVGYLLEGHFAGAESVNCGRTKRADIDIHLALVTDRPWTLDLTNRGPVECSSITAEISPHHRPIEWDILGRMTKSLSVLRRIGPRFLKTFPPSSSLLPDRRLSVP